MITTNIEEFEKKVKSFKKITWQNLNRVCKNITYQLFASVIQDTPILTGRLIANWNFSVDNPDFTTTNYGKNNRWTKYRKDPLLYQRRLKSKLKNSLNLFPDDPDSTSTGIHTYYLSNGWEYGTKIEYVPNYSSKAPQGMVRKNIQKIANMRFDKVRFI